MGLIIGGIAHLVGAKKGATAARKAAAIQTEAGNVAGRRQDLANQQALQYIEARRLNLPEPSPYPQAGGSLQAASQLAPGPPGGGMGAAAGRGGGAGYTSPITQPFSIGNTSPGGPPGRGGGQMVMLQGPDGSQKAVPAAMAQRYVSRGAKVIQQ